MDEYREIKSLLDNKDQEIPQSQVLEWMKSKDLKTLGLLYELADKAYYRVKPELGLEKTCNFILNYLTRCMIEDPKPQDSLFSGFEAAYTMASWIRHLFSKKPETDKILIKIVEKLEDLYLKGNSHLQDMIVLGCLEHVFEEEELVSLFDYWKDKPLLKQAYADALLWGQSHRGKKSIWSK